MEPGTSTAVHFSAPMCCMEVPASIVRIEKLQLPYPVFYHNVWSYKKEQPATLSITLYLQESFENSADDDTLRNSVHYGNLSKLMREKSREVMDPFDVLEHAEQCALHLGHIDAEENKIKSMITEVHLPKASMTGEGISFIWISKVDRNTILHERKFFSLRKMRLMALIGLNAHERMAKQPVITSIDFDYIAFHGQRGKRQFDINTWPAWMWERELQTIVENSSFGTLEALAGHAVQALSRRFYDSDYGSPSVKLRLEKPQAVAFAEAAVIELFVPARDASSPEIEPRPNGAPTVKTDAEVKEEPMEVKQEPEDEDAMEIKQEPEDEDMKLEIKPEPVD